MKNFPLKYKIKFLNIVVYIISNKIYVHFMLKILKIIFIQNNKVENNLIKSSFLIQTIKTSSVRTKNWNNLKRDGIGYICSIETINMYYL